MKVRNDPDGKTFWEAETTEEAAAIQYVQEHVPLFHGSETYGIHAFLAAREGYIKVYQRTDPDVLSDQDLLSVALPVAVWQVVCEALADRIIAEDDKNPIVKGTDTIDEALRKHGWLD